MIGKKLSKRERKAAAEMLHESPEEANLPVIHPDEVNIGPFRSLTLSSTPSPVPRNDLESFSDHSVERTSSVIINHPSEASAYPTRPGADVTISGTSVIRPPSPENRLGDTSVSTDSSTMLRLDNQISTMNSPVFNYQRGSNHIPVTTLNETSSQQEVHQVIANLNSVFHPSSLDHLQLVLDPVFHRKFVEKLKNCYPQDELKRDWCNTWKNWSKQDFISHLTLIFPDRIHSADRSYVERITSVDFVYDPDNSRVNDQFLNHLSMIMENFPNRTKLEDREGVKVLNRHFLPVSVVQWKAIFTQIQRNCKLPDVLQTVEQWKFVWTQVMDYCVQLFNTSLKNVTCNGMYFDVS